MRYSPYLLPLASRTASLCERLEIGHSLPLYSDLVSPRFLVFRARKAIHDEIAIKYYKRRKNNVEEIRYAEAAAHGCVVIRTFGKNIAQASIGSPPLNKKRKVDLYDSEGNALPELLLDTPSSPIVVPANVASTSVISEVGTVQRRVVKLLEQSIDILVASHCSHITTKDHGKRVALLRAMCAPKYRNWVPQLWQFQAALDFHVDPGNVIRHRRPAWESGYVAISEVAKVLKAAKVFAFAAPVSKAEAYFFYVAGCVRNAVNAEIPAGIAAVRPGRIQRLSDIPAAPAADLEAFISPIVRRAEDDLRLFLSRNSEVFPKIRPSDDVVKLLDKLANAHLAQSRTACGVALQLMPIQSVFWIEEGQKVLSTARWARTAMEEFLVWPGRAVLLLEDVVLVLSGIHELIGMLWVPSQTSTKPTRIRNDRTYITDAIDSVLAIYLAKVTVVDLRSLPVDAHGQDTEVLVDETVSDISSLGEYRASEQDRLSSTDDDDRTKTEHDSKDGRELLRTEPIGKDTDESEGGSAQGDDSKDSRAPKDGEVPLDDEQDDDDEVKVMKAELRNLLKKKRLRAQLAALREELGV